MLRLRNVLPLLLLAAPACDGAAAVDLSDAPPPIVEQSDVDSKADDLAWSEPERIDGLGGWYVRGLGGFHAVHAIELEPTAEDGGQSKGTYQGWFVDLTGFRWRTGTYDATPLNTAIGFSFIALVPDDAPPTPSDIIVVRRIARDADDTISRIEVTDLVTFQPVMTLYRLF